ncbi:MAG TPA: hypothetical protein ENK43_07020 [Planctomycetes bacterium]|nr:hypothetical protein [Planctomycetota bacterium]
MSTHLAKVILLLLTLLSGLATTRAQELLLTTKTSALGGGAPDGLISPNEVLTFMAGDAGARHRLTEHALAALIGDGDSNGSMDDAPNQINALSAAPSFVVGDATGYLVSFSTTTHFGDGSSVLDGDLVALLPQGSPQVVISENTLTAATSTGSVDLDAAHLMDDGTLIFSFAEDEVTSSTSLIAQNGGVATLDETVVFILPPGAAEASILYTKQAVVSMVNQALGLSLTTVVDLTGIAPDPNQSGAWLFCVGSSNSALEGTVFTTAGGGAVATLGGVTLDSSSFGFGEQEVLEGLAVLPPGVRPLVLHHPDESPLSPPWVEIDLEGALFGDLIQLVLSGTVFPTPHPTLVPGIGPQGWTLLDFQDPLSSLTFNNPGLARFADASGRVSWTFDTSPLLAGLRLTLQAFDLTHPNLSPAIDAQN